MLILFVTKFLFGDTSVLPSVPFESPRFVRLLEQEMVIQGCLLTHRLALAKTNTMRDAIRSGELGRVLIKMQERTTPLIPLHL